MRLRILVPALAAAVVGLGLGYAAFAGSDPPIPHEPALAVPPALPPSPSTWPPYPRFPERSCWTRPSDAGMLRASPSVGPRRVAGPAEPEELVRRLLDRFGDRRYVHRIELGARLPSRCGA